MYCTCIDRRRTGRWWASIVSDHWHDGQGTRFETLVLVRARGEGLLWLSRPHWILTWSSVVSDWSGWKLQAPVLGFLITDPSCSTCVGALIVIDCTRYLRWSLDAGATRSGHSVQISSAPWMFLDGSRVSMSLHQSIRTIFSSTENNSLSDP